MKYYILGVIVVVFPVILIVTLLSEPDSFPDKNNTKSTHNSNCTNKECMEIVSNFKLYMDQSYEPCDNFYKYSCGGWIKSQDHSTITKDKNSTHVVSEVNESNLRIIQDILESINPELDSEKKLQDFYQSCLNFNLNSTYMKSTMDLLDSEMKDTDTTNETYETNDDTECDSDAWGQDVQVPLTRRCQILKFVKIEWKKYMSNNSETTDDRAQVSQLCTAMSKKFFPDVVGRLFVERMYLPEKQDMISTIVETVRQAYLKKISQLSWMDYGSKLRLSEKIRNLKVILGYPKEIMDTDVEVQQLEGVKINSDTFLLNINQHVDLQRVNTAVSDYFELVIKVDAFYDVDSDVVLIPAAYSQSPIFHALYPPVINYAKMGFTIAHEMTHAFYNYALGNEIDPLISATSHNNFRTRSKCVEDQYSEFSVMNITLHGNKTGYEDFADIAGLQISFQTFLDNFGDSFNPLPGLEGFSKEQLFFIASAQFDCRSFRDEDTEKFVLQTEIGNLTHSPNSIRVFGEMMNSKEFSQAFNCPIGSPLNNPESRCNIFD